MKYNCSVELDLPIDQVIRLWDDEAHFAEWQDGFQSIVHLEGTPNTPGARSKIIFHQGKNVIELTETILSNKLPEEKKALYDHQHMTNIQTTCFEPLAGQKTRYFSEVEYSKFNGLMPKILAFLFPGLFKKQSQRWMQNLKALQKTLTKIIKNKTIAW
ncbi:MAG: SRPBCC family protein [Bacteroides sp.]|jgi:hypothetical protein|nr:SRPBCC family protein [Bacteroides sp.]